MEYNLVFTTMWYQTYRGCFDYIADNFQNGQAIESILYDVESVLDIIKTNAESFALCESDILRQRKLRKVHLKRHHYKIFYTVDSKNVYIRALLHDKQDFENILK